MKPKVNVYIDGFNLYFGALKNKPDVKWLDLRKFASQLFPNAQIEHVYYFTAEIHREFETDQAPTRQSTYLKVLANSGVQVVKGHFDAREKYLRLSGETGPNAKRVKVWQYEEKGSDVNLATFLLRDVYLHNLEHALVISGDSDLALALIFARDAGTRISLAIPARNETGNDRLKKSVDYVQYVKTHQLTASQFPKAVKLRSGREIVRPQEWT